MVHAEGAGGTEGRRLMPSVADLVFLLIAAAVPTALSFRLLNTDGDLGRHLRMGEFILGGGLGLPDTFSHTRYGEPFLATEWLSQVLFALAHRAGGLAGVAVLCALVVASTYFLITLFMRTRGLDPLAAYLVAILVAALGSIHWLARPHLFTMLAFAVMLFLVERADGATPPTGWRDALGFGALFLLWANFHPGYVLGLAVIAAYALGDLVEALLARRRGADTRTWSAWCRYHAVGFGVGLVASMLNPQGPGFLLRIRNHLGDTFLLSLTQEFQSPNFQSGWGRLLLIVIVGLLMGLALRRPRPSAPRLMAVLMLLAAALYAQRNAPLFALFALPVMALEWAPAWRHLTRGGLPNRLREAFARIEARSAPGTWAVVFALGLTAVGANGGVAFGTRVMPADFDARVFPGNAVAHARSERLEGTLFHEFAWGGYLLYAWPEQRIFIDGMTDFFGADVVRSYLQIRNLQPGWRDALEVHGIDLALIPPGSSLAYALDHESDWSLWYRDDVAAIYRRAQ